MIWWLSAAHKNIVEHATVGAPTFRASGVSHGLVTVELTLTNHSFTTLYIDRIEGQVMDSNDYLANLSAAYISCNPGNRRVRRTPSDNTAHLTITFPVDSLFMLQPHAHALNILSGAVVVTGRFGEVKLPIKTEGSVLKNQSVTAKGLLDRLKAYLA